MARRRPAERRGDADLIMPVELLRRPGAGADEHKAFIAERRRWFLAHDVNPGDWRRVSAILTGSSWAHGLPVSTLDRMWARAVGLEEWQRLHHSNDG